MAGIITVFGATGTQGGSVVRAILADKTFKVRGVSRNVESDKSKALSKQGVEMVQASIDDVAAVERALSGSFGVFLVTNSDGYMDSEKEFQAAKAVIDVAKKVGVKHFVFSAQNHVQKTIGRPCCFFDGKAMAEDYLFQCGMSASSVRYPAYMENMFGPMAPSKVEDGVYCLNFPMEGKPMDMLSTTAAGPAILTLFKNPAKYNGKAFGLSGDRKTVQEYCDIMNKYAAPVKVIPGTMTAEEFINLGFPGAYDLGIIFAFYQTEHAKFSIEDTKSLDPNTKDFDTYIKENLEELRALLK